MKQKNYFYIILHKNSFLVTSLTPNLFRTSSIFYNSQRNTIVCYLYCNVLRPTQYWNF